MWKWLKYLFGSEVKPPVVVNKPSPEPNPVNHPLLPPSSGMLLIQKLEGFRDKAYQDQGGIWTIGYGRTKGVKKGNICTLQQGMSWLAEDVAPAWEAIRSNVRVPLSQNQAGALLSLIYNIGVGAFLQSSVLRALNYGSLADVPSQMRKWDKITINGVKFPDKGLANRRAAEIQLFTGADWRQA